MDRASLQTIANTRLFASEMSALSNYHATSTAIKSAGGGNLGQTPAALLMKCERTGR